VVAWFGDLNRIHLVSGGRAGDEEKAGMLRRLRLFDADLFDAATFAPAIAGCQFVFLLATPIRARSRRQQGAVCQFAPVRRCGTVRVMIRRARHKLFSWGGEKSKLTFQRQNWTWVLGSEGINEFRAPTISTLLCFFEKDQR
jgi:hypothetical protein